MPQERFRIVTALPPEGGWRTELVVDRASTPPRSALLYRVPPTVTADAQALADLSRDVERASRLTHPVVLPVEGLVEESGLLAILGAYRDAEPLRTVLDASGPLSAAQAVRVVSEVAGAIQAAHALAAVGDRPLCHGHLTAHRVLVTDDGSVLLAGLGRPPGTGASQAADVRSLANLLVECLAPNGNEDLPLELSGCIGRALGPSPFLSAAALADALTAAVTPAAAGALASRLAGLAPGRVSVRNARRRALAQALRAEGGAAADEVMEEPPYRPALTPPPLRLASPPPVAAPVVRLGLEPAPPAPPEAAGSSSGPEQRTLAAALLPSTVEPARPPSAGPAVGDLGRGAASASPPAPSLLDDPRLPLLAAGVLGVVGLVLGFLIGRR